MPTGAARAVMTRRSILAALPFDAPTFALNTSGDNVTSITTTTNVSGVAGDRLVVMAAHSRGSTGSPASGVRTLSDIGGDGGFAGLDIADFTIHRDEVAQISGNVAGVRCVIASYVLVGTATGAITATWSSTCTPQLIAATILPACNIVDAVGANRNDDGTTLVLDYAAALEDNDLMLTLAGQLDDNTPAITRPSGHTSTNSIDTGISSIEGSWKNGALADPSTWSGFSGNAIPKVVAGLVARRT